MSTDCQKAIEKTGFGTCHYLIVILCGLCSLAESVAYTVFLTSIPILSCDLNIINNDVLALSGISSFGMITGSVVFGIMGDLNGRKNLIPITMLIIFCSCIGLSFALADFIVYLMVFSLGIGIAGNNVILRVYLIEFLPMKKRNVPLVILDVAWIVGYLGGFCLAWFLLPSILRHMRNQFRPSSWRVLVVIGGVPSLLMSCAIGILPSTPRYLLYRSKQGRALAVLQQIYAINYSRHANTYPETNFDHCIQPDDENHPNPTNNVIIKIKICITKSWKRIQEINRPPFRKLTIFAAIANLFQFPGYVWLAMWDTQFLQTSNNSTCRINSSTIINNFFTDCDTLDENSLESFLILSIGYVIGSTILAVFINFTKKRIFLILTGIVGGLAFFLFMFMNPLVVSIVVLGCYSIIRSLIGIFILENYPTRLRTTVFGLTKMFSYLGVTFLQLIPNAIPCTPGIPLISATLFFGSIFGSFLPDLTGKSLQE